MNKVLGLIDLIFSLGSKFTYKIESVVGSSSLELSLSLLIVVVIKLEPE